MTGMQLGSSSAFDPATTPSASPRTARHVLGSAVPFFLAYFDAQQRHGDGRCSPRCAHARRWRRAHAPARSPDVREVLGVRGIANSWGLTEFPVATYGARRR